MNKKFAPKIVSFAIKMALFTSVTMMQQAYADEENIDAKKETRDNNIEYIEVTSRHRGESLNKIPISVVSFGLEEMEKAGMRSVGDIASASVGFSMEKGYGRQSDIPVIRGVSWIPGYGTQKASYFIDGVYFDGSIQSLPLDLIERVEIVKGPQSALYGRRTFSGAINLVTRKPTDELSGYVNTTIGQNGNRSIGTGLSTKLNDMVAIRAGLSFDTYDGDWDNEIAGGPSVGGEKTNSQMIGLYFTPSNNTSIDINYVRNENDDDHSVFHYQGPDENNCYLDTRPYYCGVANIDNSIKIGGVLDNDAYGLRATRTHMSFQLKHTFDFGQFTWISGKNTFDLERAIDQTYTGYDQVFSFGFFFGGPYFEDGAAWHIPESAKDSEYSHEVRFSSSALDDRLLWSVGAYLWHKEDEPENVNEFVQEDDNKAFMAMVSYDITEDLNVSFEARRSTDEINSLAYDNLINMPGFEDTSNEFSSTTTRFIAEYDVNEDTLVYFTRSEGNSPGGFNTHEELPSDLVVIQEEEMLMYEGGIKTTLLDGDLYLSAAIYNMDWKKQQLTDSFMPDTGAVPVSYTSNAGKTNITGIELQVTYIISDSLNMNLGMSHTDAEFKTLFDSNHCRIISGLSSTECNQPDNLRNFGDLSGNTPPQVPKNEVTMALNYSAPLTANFDLFGRLDVNYDSTRYGHIHNLIETGARTLVNVNMGIENDNWSLSAWVKNATDDDTPTYIFRYIDAQSFAYASRAFPIAPSRGREVGITASYRF
ncbi:Outer membrane receptor proteins, mostly Fe transport [Colwellia chukchiensis]|uniref:Outer membrane receptor proteins, mostly Fe transport n=1 Tax=Colwellia chukchiensis TaxID=641665 RepID=A0A1H7K3I8_9GAMM|nr:TonB-dependent receptor plug domain-containing protein [Colwellia chukchiensis]SEK81433.1 Outer membrane receptor proteins, mostly Fe transport [Colwellia chukchiensis]